MGSGCGQKKSAEQAAPLPSPHASAEDTVTCTDSARAGKESETSSPVDTASRRDAIIDIVPEEEAPLEPILLSSPPAALPRWIPGMSLPAWLKLIIRPEHDFGVDEFSLLDAYHNLCAPPHLSPEALIKIALRVIPGAEEWEIEGKLLLGRVRWLNVNEAADVFAAGNEASGPRGLLNKEPLPSQDRNAVGTETTLPSGSASAVTAEVPTASPGAPPPSSKTDAAPQTVDDIIASLPKRDFDGEFEVFKDGPIYSDVLLWLGRVIIEDPTGVADPGDVARGYNTQTAATDSHHQTVGAEIMYRAMMTLFSNSEPLSAGEAEQLPVLKGLKWKALEAPMCSMALPHLLLPEKERNEAHKLLHVPDSERTRLWLKTLFVTQTGMSLSMPSLWNFYERIHWRWTDTHLHLEMEKFLELVPKVFPSCKIVEVSQGYDVVVGLHWREKARSAKEVLTRKQKANLRRIQRAGEIDPPKSAFAQKLLQDPLLMRVHKDQNGCRTLASYTTRTRRRGGDPDSADPHERLPFGDEEPGFPGLSMKRQQAQYKHDAEKYKKKVQATARSEAYKNVGLPPPPADVPQDLFYGDAV